jgi:hypothetical protein
MKDTTFCEAERVVQAHEVLVVVMTGKLVCRDVIRMFLIQRTEWTCLHSAGQKCSIVCAFVTLGTCHIGVSSSVGQLM